MKEKEKTEIIKEIQRILLKKDISVKCVYDLGKWLRDNLETAEEYGNKPEFRDFLNNLKESVSK